MTADLARGSKLSWSELDSKAVDTVRVLAMDAVEKSGNGHPGKPFTAFTALPALCRHCDAPMTLADRLPCQEALSPMSGRWSTARGGARSWVGSC